PCEQRLELRGDAGSTCIIDAFGVAPITCPVVAHDQSARRQMLFYPGPGSAGAASPGFKNNGGKVTWRALLRRHVITCFAGRHRRIASGNQVVTMPARFLRVDHGASVAGSRPAAPAHDGPQKRAS